MLDGTRDTNGHVELRSDNLASLTDLQAVVGVTTVDSRTGSTDGSAEGVSKGEHDLVELLLGLETTATRDNLLGGREVGAVRLGKVLGNPLGGALGLGVNTILDGSGTGADSGRGERGTADGDDLDGVGGLDGRNGVAGVEGAHKGVLGLDGGDVGDLLAVEKSGDAGHQVLAESRRAGEDVGVTALLDVLNQERSVVLGEALCSTQTNCAACKSTAQTLDERCWRITTNLVVGTVLDGNDLLDTLDLGRLLGDGLHIAGGNESMDGTTELRGSSDGAEGSLVELAVSLLEDSEGGQ